MIRDLSGQSTYPGTVDYAKYFAIQSDEDLYDDVNWGGPMLKTLTLCAASVLILGSAVVYSMGRHDAQALSDFSASYEHFDNTVSEETLNDLQVKSAMKISSLTKNDGAMMKVARQVSDLAASEVSLMKASQLENDREAGVELNARLTALQHERKAAYAHFQRLLAAPPNSD